MRPACQLVVKQLRTTNQPHRTQLYNSLSRKLPSRLQLLAGVSSRYGRCNLESNLSKGAPPGVDRISLERCICRTGGRSGSTLLPELIHISPSKCEMSTGLQNSLTLQSDIRLVCTSLGMGQSQTPSGV